MKRSLTANDPVREQVIALLRRCVGQKLVVAAVGLLAIAAHNRFLSATRLKSVSSAQSSATAFDVTSVKVNKDRLDTPTMRDDPAGITYINLPFKIIVGNAYQIPYSRIIGGSADVQVPNYDIIAKTERSVSKEQLRQMVQAMLAERFRLISHQRCRLGVRQFFIPAYPGPLYRRRRCAAFGGTTGVA